SRCRNAQNIKGIRRILRSMPGALSLNKKWDMPIHTFPTYWMLFFLTEKGYKWTKVMSCWRKRFYMPSSNIYDRKESKEKIKEEIKYQIGDVWYEKDRTPMRVFLPDPSKRSISE